MSEDHLFNDVCEATARLKVAKEDGKLAEHWDKSDEFLQLIKKGTKVGIGEDDLTLVAATEALSRLFSDLICAALEEPREIVNEV